MARWKDDGGFYCLAHRERVSMTWFSPRLGLATIKLVPYLLPEDLEGALDHEYLKGKPEVQRLFLARVPSGLRVAQLFRSRHTGCQVDAGNFGAPGFWAKVKRAAERAGIVADPDTFWVRSFTSAGPAPFLEADATEATRMSKERLETLRAVTKERERRLAKERIPIMERALIENELRDAQKVLPWLERDNAEPLPPAPVADHEALVKDLSEAPLVERLDIAL